MAKVGYIFIATNGEEYAEDKAWMQQYGCVQVIEELSEHERLRPMWKQLISLSLIHICQINRMISLAQITNNQNVELDPKTLSQPYRL